MRKNIKIRAKLIAPKFEEVEITLVSQSHFGYNFSDSTKSSENCTDTFIHNRFSLISFLGSVCARHVNTGVLFIPDIIPSAEYAKVAIVSIENYKRIKEAIIAYNNYEFEEV